MAVDLDQVLPLKRASLYQFPQDGSQWIPRVFGDWLDPLAIDSDPTPGGYTPTVCINRLTLVYAVNDALSSSTAPQVYFNKKLQEASAYIWTPNTDYEGQGSISTLTFRLASVLNGTVSVRFAGSVDSGLLPITNPIRALADTFLRYAGWQLSDFDVGTSERTAQDLDTLGYTFYWVFDEEQTIGDWLDEILPMYHCDYTVTGESRLSLILDRSLTTFSIPDIIHIRADQIDGGTFPAGAIVPEIQSEELANQVTLHVRYNWATDEPTLDYTWTYAPSVAAYGRTHPVEFSFRGMYTSAHAIQWLNSFAIRHGFDPTLVTVPLHGLWALGVVFPRMISVEWPLYGWQQHLLKVWSTTIDWDDRRVVLQCIDCTREVTDAVTSPVATPTSRVRQITRLHEWVPGEIGPGGNMVDHPPDPDNIAANGDFEQGDNGQWNLFSGDPAKRWEIVESLTESYQGRFYARSVLAGGPRDVSTMRHRIDPGQWVLVSAWFRQHSSTDGEGFAKVNFFDIDDAFVSGGAGNPVLPTTTYLESVVMIPAPANAFYFRPTIDVAPSPTTGQWRADYVRAAVGSQAEILAIRANDLAGRNLVLNGDCEMGDVNWDKDPGWYFDTVLPRSGKGHLTHAAEATPNLSRRVTNRSKIPVSAGMTLQLEGFWRSLSATGQVRLGASWLDGQQQVISEEAMPLAAPAPGSYVVQQSEGSVPNGAIYASFWAETFNHTGSNNWWLLDDFSVSVSTAVGEAQIPVGSITEYFGATILPGIYTGETIIDTSPTISPTTQTGHLSATGTVVITLGATYTVLLQVKRSNLAGRAVASTLYQNVTANPVTIPLAIFGVDRTPLWGGVYVLSLLAIDTSNLPVAVTVVNDPTTNNFSCIVTKK